MNNIVFGYLHMKVHFYFKSRQAGISLLTLVTSALEIGSFSNKQPSGIIFFFLEFTRRAPSYSTIKKLTVNAI